MYALKRLGISEINDFFNKLSSFYGCNLDNLKSYIFYFNERNNKIYLTNCDIDTLNLKKINGVGLYLGTMHDNNRFRLSIDGSQLINAKKNFITLNEQNMKNYIAGENLFLDEIEKIDWQDNCPFLIVKYKDENLGCCTVKNNEIFCFVPKSRRLNSSRIF